MLKHFCASFISLELSQPGKIGKLSELSFGFVATTVLPSLKDNIEVR